jgi:protease secretion system outer membrane protein
MKPWLIRSAWMLLLTTPASQAQTLSHAFEAALRHDATFQAARAEFDASRQLLPLARASRLPALSATASDSRVEGTRNLAGLSGPVRSPLDYASPQHALSLRVPILNPEAYHREKVAMFQVEQARRVLDAREVDLLDRTASALLTLRKSKLLAALAEERVTMATTQADEARSRLVEGEGTRSEVSDAQSGLALARAAQRESGTAVTIAELSLSHLIGRASEELTSPGLPRTGLPWPSEQVAQDGVATLLEQARARHPAIAARRHAVDAAAAALRRSEAGHLPRADLVLSASTSRNESVSTLNQTISQRVISAQLNLPLYSGGAVQASVAQAAAELRKAESELSAEEQLVEREVTRLVLVLHDLNVRLDAQSQAVESAAMAVRATALARQAGLGSRGNESQARLRLVQERFALVELLHQCAMNWIRLQLQSGEAPVQVVQRFDAQIRVLDARSFASSDR